MRFVSRNLKAERFLGRALIILGLLVLSQGLAVLVLACLGFAHQIAKAFAYTPFTLMMGIGLVGWGWSALREAAAVEREHQLRIQRRGNVVARRRGAGSRSKARTVESMFRTASDVPDPRMARDFPGLYRSF